MNPEKKNKRTIGNESTDPKYYYDLGVALHNQGKFDEAISCYQKVLELKPDYVEAYFNLGSVSQDQGKLDEAIKLYRKTLELKPGLAAAFTNLGNTFQAQGKLKEAISCYQKALQLKPDSVEAYFNLGSAFQDQGKLDEATACYKKAMRIQPDAGIQVKSCLALPVITKSRESIKRSRRILVENIRKMRNEGLSLEDPDEQVGSTHFLLAYHGLDDKEIQRKIASFYIDSCPDLTGTFSKRNKKCRIGDRIRIGIISRHLFNHTIGNINHGIIKQLSREKFHVKLFRFPEKEDAVSKDIDNSADEVVVLPTKLKLARKKIASHPLDILFYLDIGMEPLTYFLAFSRMAPVQCVTWGHPVTTGIPNIDYYISSETAEPPGSQSHYSERLVLLKRLVMHCYRPKMDDEVPSREKFGLSPVHKLYVCPQTLFKLHPDFDGILEEILRHDPHGLVVLFKGKHSHWEKLLLERFACTIPDVISRVRFLPRMPKKDYLSFLRVADVLLDTLHFSGGYTSLLSFACGVPVVTWPGTQMRGRLTLALYKQMGVMDCVADDPQSYANIACKAANDKTWADEVRRKIKTHADVLFEDNEVVRELESFFEKAVKEALG
jgi:predicted O-linked N-acetylglucosamine transferase (SPINDLY family)